MDKPGEFTHASLEESTKHDDAEIPIWLWNDRLKSWVWYFLEGREWEAAMVVLHGFGLLFWRRKVMSSLCELFNRRYAG
jgi:hypothetical protein